MESSKKTSFILLLLLQVCITKCQECPSHPDQKLPCYNDFNHTISCEWNSTLDHADTVCTLSTQDKFFIASCDLKPVDVSRPALRACSLIFDVDYAFIEHTVINLNIHCGSQEPIVFIAYKPSCHIKVNPGKLVVSHSTISWSCDHEVLDSWDYELQWKLRDESWSDAKKLTQEGQKTYQFKEEVDEQLLIKGETYEARVRMKQRDYGLGPWSDWSPPVMWESPVGRPKQTSDIAVSIWQMIVVGVSVAVVLLGVVFLRLEKTTWAHITKRMRGAPIPNPGLSFLKDMTLQGWMHPYLTSDSFHSFLKPVEIVSVEVTSTVDAIDHGLMPETKTTRDKSTFESSGSSFSNPSYSQVCANCPPMFPLSAGNLEACTSDSPYGSVRSGTADQQSAEATDEATDMDILKLLCTASTAGESAVEMVSDYEKAEKLQPERFRLQSLDSGICSAEEASQESMEAYSLPSINEDEEEGWEENGGSGIKVDFQKLLGCPGSVFGKGSILVCSDYEAVESLCSNPGLDSSFPRKAEEEKSSESAVFLIPLCPSVSQPPLACAFSGLSSPSPNPLLIAAGSSVEPSGDGYMPVKQEQS